MPKNETPKGSEASEMSPGSGNPSMSGMATYRIRVRGRVPRLWVGRLGGMRVEDGPDPESADTVLFGHVSDQAELTGILATLYELHLPVVSVEWVAPPPETSGRGQEEP